MMRTDSPTGSRDSFSWFFLVQHRDIGIALLLMQPLFIPSQEEGIERLHLLMMPKQQPPPGCEPGEVREARGSIYGTRDASRSWCQYLRDPHADNFQVHESALEKGPAIMSSRRDSFVTASRVDDLLYAWDTRCETKALLDAIVKEFNMSRKHDDFVVCGRRVRVTTEASFISQEFAASSFLPTVLTHNRAQRLSQLQPRPDLSHEVNRAAQRSSCPHDCRCSSL